MRRWASNYQPPPVKKARKERAKHVEAVVVILASSKSGLHFTQQAAWHEWAEDAPAIGFAVYAEDHSSLEKQCNELEWDFWRPFLCPVQCSSAWGEFSLLRAELLALTWASERFEKAAWFYVVSGDSVPAKTPAAFVQGPSSRNSFLGFDPNIVTKAPNGENIREHSQWKVLSRAHVLRLVDASPLDKWQKMDQELKRRWCCVIAADEWVIGAVLRSKSSSKRRWMDGTCIMEQEFVSEKRKCCGQNAGHAKLLSTSRFALLYKRACADENTFALRKVR